MFIELTFDCRGVFIKLVVTKKWVKLLNEVSFIISGPLFWGVCLKIFVTKLLYEAIVSDFNT